MMKMSASESRPDPAAPTPARPRRTRQLDRRPALLAALHAAGRPLHVAEAADAVGISASTARFHLSLLVTAGRVIRTPARAGTVGRPSWRYAPAPRAAETDGAYRELARVLAARLDDQPGAAAAGREAGRRWADAVRGQAPSVAPDRESAIASLTDVLDRLGFAPDAHPAADEILLRACPFESVAREHRAVVCGVHLGLVEQTAETIGGGLRVEGLEPFRDDEPLTCAVRLNHSS